MAAPLTCKEGRYPRKSAVTNGLVGCYKAFFMTVGQLMRTNGVTGFLDVIVQKKDELIVGVHDLLFYDL
jgi:hypothetical protein